MSISINGILPYTVIHFTYQLSSPNWYLCDGSNGTPNLLGAIIQGVNVADQLIGQLSGSSLVELTPANLPPHTHSISAYEYVADTLQPSVATGIVRKIVSASLTQWETANAGVPVSIPTTPPSVKLYPYIYIP